MSRPSDGALKSPMGSDGIRETQETDSAPIELGQYQDVIEPSPPLTPYCSDPILVEHKNRGSLSVFDKTVDEENILSFCATTGKNFESAAIIFDSESRQKDFENCVRQMPEKTDIRFNVYQSFAEFKMPESRAHGRATHTVIRLMQDAILNTFYTVGTSFWDSNLSSDGTASIEIGNTIRSPDISLCLDDVDENAFMIGEVGVTDSGSLTRNRIIRWLDDSEGRIRLGISIDIQLAKDQRHQRNRLEDIVLDFYHLSVPDECRTPQIGRIQDIIHFERASLKDPFDRIVRIPRQDIFPDDVSFHNLALKSPLPQEILVDFDPVWVRVSGLF